MNMIYLLIPPRKLDFKHGERAERNTMKAADRRKLEAIIDGMKCPKNFICAEGGFDRLCKAQGFGMEGLECLEDKPLHCKFSIPFGTVYLCDCPLRAYLAKKLRK